MKPLGEQWREFRTTAFEPVNLTLFIGLAILFYLSPPTQNGALASLIFVLITIGAAILGARVTKQLSESAGESLMKARGRLSVRSLSILLRNIAAFERRVKLFHDAEEHIQKHPEVTKRNYEEALGICVQLEEQVVSSIENWTDIVPEADIKTQIGLISDLRSNLEATTNELATARATLEREKGSAGARTSSLLETVTRLQGELEQQKRELREKTSNLGALSFIGLGNPGLKLSDILLLDTGTGTIDNSSKPAGLAAAVKPVK